MAHAALTKREKQIMDILWENDKPLAASEIQEISGISIFTVQQVLQRLLKREWVKVADYGQNKKVIMRLYGPQVTQADYISAFITEENKVVIMENYIAHSKDVETLNALQEKIQKRLKTLSKKK